MVYFGENVLSIAKFVRIWILFEQESVHSSETRMSRDGSEGCETTGVQHGLSPTGQQHVRCGAEFFNIFFVNRNVVHCIIYFNVSCFFYLGSVCDLLLYKV